MMRPSNYLPKSFSDILESGAVTVQTRTVLQARLGHAVLTAPLFFSEFQFETVKAVCARLIPQGGESDTVDLPGLLDEQLSKATGKGWRYDTLPPDTTMYPLGLEGLSQTAILLFGAPFYRIPPSQQDEVLAAVQSGKAPGAAWRQLPAERFFEELLAAVTALYYSHPIAKRLIQDFSFADARGWHYIGLEDQHDYSSL